MSVSPLSKHGIAIRPRKRIFFAESRKHLRAVNVYGALPVAVLLAASALPSEEEASCRIFRYCGADITVALSAVCDSFVAAYEEAAGDNECAERQNKQCGTSWTGAGARERIPGKKTFWICTASLLW